MVYGNVYEPDTTWAYGYGTYPAPNHNLAFCQIVTGEGGPDQGAQQLSVFNDFENLDHKTDRLIESNVFQEQIIGPENIGQGWVWTFNAKMGNLEGSSTACAFIKTIDPASGWAMTNFISEDMTSIPATWGSYTITILLTHPDLEGQYLQFGFMNVASHYEGSGIFYDNVEFYQSDLVDAPHGPVVSGPELNQNYPNPFNPMTRIDFALDLPGRVDISVFDIAGHRVATLHQGQLEAGEHHVIWNGKTDRGNAAPAGLYHYVLKTATDKVSRSMVLLK